MSIEKKNSKIIWIIALCALLIVGIAAAVIVISNRNTEVAPVESSVVEKSDVESQGETDISDIYTSAADDTSAASDISDDSQTDTSEDTSEAGDTSGNVDESEGVTTPDESDAPVDDSSADVHNSEPPVTVSEPVKETSEPSHENSNSEIVSSCSHEFETIEVPHTQSEDAYKLIKCKKCGYSYRENYDPYTRWQKSFHVYDDKIIKPATANEDGLLERVCNICGYRTTEVIPKTIVDINDQEAMKKAYVERRTQKMKGSGYAAEFIPLLIDLDLKLTDHFVYDDGNIYCVDKAGEKCSHSLRTEYTVDKDGNRIKQYYAANIEWKEWSYLKPVLLKEEKTGTCQHNWEWKEISGNSPREIMVDRVSEKFKDEQYKKGYIHQCSKCGQTDFTLQYMLVYENMKMYIVNDNLQIFDCRSSRNDQENTVAITSAQNTWLYSNGTAVGNYTLMNGDYSMPGWHYTSELIVNIGGRNYNVFIPTTGRGWHSISFTDNGTGGIGYHSTTHDADGCMLVSKVS